MVGICDKCKYRDSCPYFQPGKQVCDVEELYLAKVSHIITDDFALPQIIKKMLEEKVRRYARARFFEQMSGGEIVKEVSRLENEIADIVEKYMKVQYPERFRVTKVVHGEEGKDVEDEYLRIAQALGLTEDVDSEDGVE